MVRNSATTDMGEHIVARNAGRGRWSSWRDHAFGELSLSVASEDGLLRVVMRFLHDDPALPVHQPSSTSAAWTGPERETAIRRGLSSALARARTTRDPRQAAHRRGRRRCRRSWRGSGRRPTGSNARPTTSTASCSRAIPICGGSSPITASRDTRCARTFPLTGLRGGPLRRGKASSVVYEPVEPRTRSSAASTSLSPWEGTDYVLARRREGQAVKGSSRDGFGTLQSASSR